MPLRATPCALDELVAAQAAVLRRDQLHAARVSSARLSAQLRAERWQECGPVVIVLHNGPLTPEQQRWAAVLDAGPGAALCGRTAATLDGLRDWDDDWVHVLVRRGGRPNPLPGVPVVVHESRRYVPARDRHPMRLPPRTRFERSVVDAAVWTGRRRTAAAIAVAAVQQRRTRAPRLLAELAAAGQVRHRTLLCSVLHDVAGGAEALSEIDFLAFCRRHRLPRPVHQSIRLDRHGRRRYLDATFERPGGRTVAVEVDGAVHLVVGSYWSDMCRANEIVIGGDRLLRFPSVAIYLDADVVVDQLRRVLRVDL